MDPAFLDQPLIECACNRNKNNPIIRFGMIADPHYARREMYINRYYYAAIEKVQQAVNIFNRNSLNFIIELGDLKDMGIHPHWNETMSFLDEIEAELQKFDGPVYHVMGNHDMDSISKKDFLSHTVNYNTTKDKEYYSFIINNVKFIVLDANYNPDGTNYDRGNYDWTASFIPAVQLAWLINELNCNYPVVIFVHQLLDSFSKINQDHFILNAAETRYILENNGQVLAVFQGHYHIGSYSMFHNIHYYTLSGMVENPLPINSFAIVEIYKDFRINIQGFGMAKSYDLIK